ncbi:Ku protein [Microvirga sp. KLBC 81]|uniref:Ku protein n=1 Tax=Microvirga sp. KLBC 81 TaxID=1862707 RepID=UPI00352FE09B
MARRANWKGCSKLPLDSCAIELCPATSSSERVRFRTLSRKNREPGKRQFIDAETNEVVEFDQQVKGCGSARAPSSL